MLAALILASPAAGDDDADPRAGPLIRLTRDGQPKRRPDWSPDGRTLAYARHEPDDAHLRVYLVEPSAGADPAPRRVTARTEPEFDATFAPDGRRLLMVQVRYAGTQGNLELAAVGADGSNPVTLFADTARVVHHEWPAWSPDGRRFAFTATRDGNQEVYTAAADGTDVVRLTQHPGLDAHPCWSPDGSAIAFATDRWSGLELASIQPDGTGLVRLTRSPGLDDYPAYSPDGRRLAFVSNRDGQFEVYLADAAGSNPVNLSRHPLPDTMPRWTHDGRGVTFVSSRDGGQDLYTQPVRARNDRGGD